MPLHEIDNFSVEDPDFGSQHDIRHRFGGFADGNRQNAGGERVERAAMADFLSADEALYPADDLRRAAARRFIDDQPTIEARSCAYWLIHWAAYWLIHWAAYRLTHWAVLLLSGVRQ